jgi:hypothetical protein
MARPALEALAEQQAQLARQAQLIQKQEAHIAGLTRIAQNQQEQINRFGLGLRAISQLAGVEGKVVTAMTKKADAQNPAQPVPEPPAVPATQTTQEVEAPEAMANVQTPGLVPGSTNNVGAAATTTAYTPGQDIAGPAFSNLVDVTAPVAGTQGPLPLAQVKTESDVRVGDPMVSTTAFPLQGDFANAQRTSALQQTEAAAAASNRTMACIRLARLQIQSGIAEGSDISIATEIEKDASLTNDAIERQIMTLEQVKTASGRQNRNPRLVPRTATQRPAAPSMQNQGISATASNSLVDNELEDAELFLS